MAKPINPNLKPFKKGSVPPRKTNVEQAKRTKLTKDHYKLILDEILHNTLDHLKIALEDPNVPLIRKWLIRGALMAAQSGKLSDLELLVTRSIGKPKEEIDVNLHKPVILTRRDGTEEILTTEEAAET